MRIKVTDEITRYNGDKIIYENFEKKESFLNVKHVIGEALTTGFKSEADTISGQQIHERSLLATRIFKSKKHVTVSIEEAVLIKELVAKRWRDANVVSFIFTLIDPTDESS